MSNTTIALSREITTQDRAAAPALPMRSHLTGFLSGLTFISGRALVLVAAAALGAVVCCVGVVLYAAGASRG